MEEFLRDNWLSIAIVIVQAVWGWLLWSLKKQFVSVESHTECQDKRGKRLGTVEGGIAALVHRLEIVERDVKALPTVQGISQLNLELERLRGEMQGIRPEIQGLRDSMKSTERQLSLLIENELRARP